MPQRDLQPQRCRLPSSAPGEFVAYSGTGSFTQIRRNQFRLPSQFGLILGFNPGASGTYSLSGGSLYAPNEYVGYSGTGNFTQSGGTNAIPGVGSLSIAYSSGSGGTYSLSGSGLLIRSH